MLAKKEARIQRKAVRDSYSHERGVFDNCLIQ